MIITTILGEIDDSLLEKHEGVVDNDNEYTTWIEYWKDGELVHRSVHVTIKRLGVLSEGLLAGFEGG